MESVASNSDFLNEPVYAIGLAAEKLGVAVPTLRMYEHAGLIIPFKTKNGRRLYSKNDLKHIQVIIDLIRIHKLNLKAIKTLCSLTPCWNIIDCPTNIRDNCNVYSNGHIPCWLEIDKKCDIKTLEDCRQCKVYLSCPKMLKNPKQFFKENY
jgi:MerR family transcriptional regulator, heat shock protein HspR